MQNPENRRAHPRVELVATVEVAAGGGDLVVLTATNLSMGGVFLEAVPSDYPVFRRGVLVELSISLADSASVDDTTTSAPPPPQVVRAKGKIVRIQMPAPETPSGFGIVITELGKEDVPRLHALLAQAPASKAPAPKPATPAAKLSR